MRTEDHANATGERMEVIFRAAHEDGRNGNKGSRSKLALGARACEQSDATGTTTAFVPGV
jgi:hypothetical protein